EYAGPDSVKKRATCRAALPNGQHETGFVSAWCGGCQELCCRGGASMRNRQRGERRSSKGVRVIGPRQTRWWIGVWSVLMLCSGIGGRPTAVPSAAVVDFQTTRYTLPGGLRVVAEQTVDSDIGGVVLLVRAGSAAEPQGLGGIAHLTEHLVFQSRQDGKPSFWESLG